MCTINREYNTKPIDLVGCSISKKALKRLIDTCVEERKSTIMHPKNRLPINISEIGFQYDKFLGYKAYFVQFADKLLHEKFLIHKLRCGAIYDIHQQKLWK